jgi:hypothetical protein
MYWFFFSGLAARKVGNQCCLDTNTKKTSSSYTFVNKESSRIQKQNNQKIKGKVAATFTDNKYINFNSALFNENN